MAVVRARSAPPYGLIAFVVLWVISTGLAILFYVKYSQADTQVAELTKGFGNIATPQERTSIAQGLLTGSAEKNLTALRVAQNQIDGMKTLMTGDTRLAYNDVMAQAQGALKHANRGEKDALIAALNALADDRDAKAKQLADLTTQLNGINEQIRTGATQSGERQTALQKENDELRAQLVKATEDVSKTAASRDEAVTKGQDELSKLVATSEEQRRNFVLQIEQLRSEIAKGEAQIKDLRFIVDQGRNKDQNAVGEPDGVITQVNAPNNEVYINLRTSDRMVPGLTFTVYDSRAGVRFGSDEEAEGKGAIEVIQPGETSTLCRITHTVKGKSIQRDDVIANTVYHNSKNRKYHFVVTGDFDLDGDGVATADERNRLIRIITSWGGLVENGVSTQTDYVVFGTRPSSSLITTTEPAATGSAVDVRSKLQANYDDLISEAKRLSIPTLNANRFFAMIGHYGTTIVKY